MLEQRFMLRENQTTVGREVVGGLTTFLTMSYIVFVQPALLSSAGMDFGAVMVATCVAAGAATILMGLLANYPIALAPAMGHNIFFVYVVCGAMGVSWQMALGANCISGLVFIALAFFGIREKIMEAVPGCLRFGIAAGIGMLIALLGFQWAGIVVDTPGVLVGMGSLQSPAVLTSLLGLAVASILLVLRVPGALLLGILATTLAGLAFGIATFGGVVDAPPSIRPTFLKLQVSGLFSVEMLSVVFVFFFLDLFDTVGTLIGVGEQGGFMREGKLPRARPALLSDAIGTVGGTLLGTSTTTSYIESSTGIASGARTGLANLVTGCLFLLALFFYPLVKMIGGGYEVSEGVFIYPMIAPVLILVGVFMISCVKKIEWDDLTEAIPAFLTIMVIAFTVSITEGIAFGFISYALLKTVTGRGRQVHALIYLFALLFILRYAFLKA